MFRTVALVGLALATLGGAIAGTVVPVDLTTAVSYSASCNTANCVPTLPTSQTTGTWLTSLFSSVYNSSPGLPSPGSAPQNTSNPPNTPFILDAQNSTNGSYDQYVSALSTNTDSEVSLDLGACTGRQKTTACGLYNADDIFTMLQGTGAFGYQGITITVTGETAGGVAIDDTIDLTSGVDYRSTRNNLAQQCDVANPSTTSPGTTCTNYGSDTAQTSGLDSNPGGTLPDATVTVFNNAFGTLTNTRTYYWDVQEINLGGLFLGGYLDSVTIENVSGSTASQLVLNGLSVDVAAPEPSTLVMFGIALGLVGLWRVRANRSKSICG